jgi:hypothetical protein
MQLLRSCASSGNAFTRCISANHIPTPPNQPPNKSQLNASGSALELLHTFKLSSGGSWLHSPSGMHSHPFKHAHCNPGNSACCSILCL